MTDLHETIKHFIAILSFVTIFILTVLPVVAMAVDQRDVYDLWNTIGEFEEVSSLRKLLLSKDWASEDVSTEELDYILVLTQQCSSEFFPNVSPSLALAVISIESGFQKDLVGFNNDTGLMQVIPGYHYDRIQKYIYDDDVDLKDPRVNIMSGMDYLSELIEWANGDISKALMAYNMGEDRAIWYYDAGRTTAYAEKVLQRMNALDEFFERRR